MKSFASFLILAMVLCVSAAHADSTLWQATIMNQTTGNGAAYRVDHYPKKTATIGSISGTGFANYSGVVTLQGSPNGTGQWVTLKDVGGNAVTKTHDLTAAGAIFNLEDSFPYYRAVFTPTSGATKNKVSVIINYSTFLTGQP